MKLADIKLRDLLPIFMRRDDFDCALADALSAPLQTFARECRKLSTFDALSELSEVELDALADELNVLWYGMATTVDQKRALLAISDKTYMTLGSRAAVQNIVSVVFGDATIQEFWEYESKGPHYFRIFVNNTSVLVKENEVRLRKLLSIVSRRSQWLETITSEIITGFTPRIACMHGEHKTYLSQFTITI